MAEDFTTYTEADPDSQITKTATRCTWTDLERDTDSWLYDDKGLNHFASDFEHLIDCFLTASDNLGYVHFWMLTQDVRDAHWQQLNGEAFSCVFHRDSGGTHRIYLLVAHGGAWEDNDAYICAITTNYYLKLKRVEGAPTTLQCFVYDAATRLVGDLLDTLNCSPSTDEDFQNIFACNVYKTGTTQKQSGYCQNLDLQEAPPAGYAHAQGVII